MSGSPVFVSGQIHRTSSLKVWYINSVPASLNCDDGGLSPEAYSHLINRERHQGSCEDK